MMADSDYRINCGYCGAEFSAVLASRGPWRCPNCHARNPVPFNPYEDCWACRHPATQWEFLPDGRRRCSHCGFVPQGTPPGGDKPPTLGDLTGPPMAPEERLAAAAAMDAAFVRFIADTAEETFRGDPTRYGVVERLRKMADGAPGYDAEKGRQFRIIVSAARPKPVYTGYGHYTGVLVEWLEGLEKLLKDAARR